MDMLKLCISVGAVWGCDHPELMVWGRFKHKNSLVKKNDHVLAYLVLSPHTWLEIVLTSHQKYPVLLPLPQLQIVWISCQKYLFLLPLTQLYIVWTSRQEYSILLTPTQQEIVRTSCQTDLILLDVGNRLMQHVQNSFMSSGCGLLCSFSICLAVPYGLLI